MESIHAFPGDLFMRSKAFTILELLVSMAIIFALMATVMAVVPAAKRRAQEAPCSSNLRQLYIAYELYCQEYDGWNIPAKHLELITQYVTDNRIFSCPAEDFIRPMKAGKYPAIIGLPWDDIQQNYVDFKISYFYMPDYEPGGDPEFWRAMQTKESVGFLSCIWHGRITKRAPGIGDRLTPMVYGPILRLCFDGHIKHVPPASKPGFASTYRLFYSPFMPIPVAGEAGEWGTIP